MNNTLRCLLAAASAAVLITSASAQVGRAAGTGAAAVRPTIPPMPPASVNASAAAQNAASAAATMRPPVVPPSHAAAATAGTVGASASASHRPEVVGSANASATGQLHGANGLDVAATHGINATVNTTQTTAEIQQTTFATRNQLSADLQAQVDATAKALLEAKARADAAGDQTRAEFARAMRDVRAKEKEFRAALKAAVKSTNESTWGEVQSKLAKDYSAYATAVLAAEAAANGNASTTTTTPPKS